MHDIGDTGQHVEAVQNGHHDHAGDVAATSPDDAPAPAAKAAGRRALGGAAAEVPPGGADIAPLPLAVLIADLEAIA